MPRNKEQNREYMKEYMRKKRVNEKRMEKSSGESNPKKKIIIAIDLESHEITIKII